MDFGTALRATVTHQARISRDGWNGVGMWVAYEPGEETPSPERDTDRFEPCLMIRTVDRSYVPWLPSQSDLFAEDWVVSVYVTGRFDEPGDQDATEANTPQGDQNVPEGTEPPAKGWGGIR